MSPEMEMYGLQAPDNYFHIDDLLDFSNDDLFSTTTTTTHDSDLHHLPPTTTNPTSGNISNTNNFINNNNHNQNRIPNFSDDLCVPNDDVAELEWLSKFVDDSFSDFSMNDITGTANFSRQQEPSSIPGTKARSKRSRVASTHKSWISLPESSNINLSSPVVIIGTKSKQSNSKIRSEMISSLSSPSSSSVSAGGHVIGNGDHHHQSSSTSSSSSSGGGGGGGGRKCTHCASEKTPQWRTGPMGPKTLCNACGVRYKSGRLVPEYRPAASPTFVLTQHSNSHRKVMELRRQKEILTGSTSGSSHHHHHDHNNNNNDHNNNNNNNNSTHEFFHHPHHDFEVC